MALLWEAVTFEVADADAVASFWAGLLDRPLVAEPGGVLVPGDEPQLGLRFVASDREPLGRPRLHLHLTSSSLEHQQRTVDTALRLGGRHLDVGQAPDDPHVVLADPGGTELCVIEPGNNYLAGTGPLGEITCAGTRTVGLFWRDALAWPLVWDEGAQTAIQSPRGGTKISWDIWTGPPAGPRRHRFDLLATDPTTEAARLVSIGATRLPDALELADPDGTTVRLRTP